jgi:hypothetical protein
MTNPNDQWVEVERWWNRELKSKVSVRVLLVWAVLYGAATLGHDWRGFVGRFCLVNLAIFAAEGMASLWPTAFARR